MTGEEYSELAALWNAPPAPAEERELEQLARRTPQRARLVQYGELVVVAAISVAIIGAILWRIGPGTILSGALVLLILAVSAWKRHRLIDLALLVDRSDRATYLASLVRGKEAELRRSTLGLILIWPATLLAFVLLYFLKSPATEAFVEVVLSQLFSRQAVGAIFLLAVAVALSVRAHVRIRRELATLRGLAAEYAAETRHELGNRG